VTFQLADRYPEFAKWRMDRLAGSNTMFALPSGHSYLFGEWFRVDSLGHLRLSQLHMILAREFNLYCEFMIQFNDCVIDDEALLDDFEDVTDFRIE
jgi:hypothetical protein